MIDRKYELPSVILTGHHIERVLKENLNSSGLTGYKPENDNRVECSSIGYGLMSKKGFDLCFKKISDIYKQELHNKIFLLPLIQFDPRLLPSDRVSILDQESIWIPKGYSLVLKFNTPISPTPSS